MTQTFEIIENIIHDGKIYKT